MLKRAILGFVSALIFICGCATDKQVISQAQDVNQQLEPAIVKDQALADYIQKVGNRIVATAKILDSQGFGPDSHKKDKEDAWMYQSMQFHLVNSKTLNAFTTGGKHMYIYTELFQTCKNEDELAAVMSHEYAHVYCRHVIKGMNRQYAMLGAAGAAGAAGYVAGGKDNGTQYAGVAAGAAGLVGQYIGMGFTRDDENEADKIGFWFHAHAGWDPNRFAGFFQTLIDKGLDKTPEEMSDHPKLSNRVIATNERIKQLPANAKSWRKSPVVSETEFRRLQTRAMKVSKSTPDDQSIQKAQLMLAAFPSCVTPVEQPDQKNAQAIIYQAMQKKDKP